MNDDLRQQALVIRAKAGDKQALEELVLATQSYVYNLAIRMVQTPMDAEDATQEILIKIVTHLSSFRGESAFSTWVYRIAANHLVNVAQRRSREQHLTFDHLSAQLERSLALGQATVEEAYDTKVLSEEVRRSCTLGMLLCLDREQRIALILGELLQIDSATAAYILDISPAAFRKRLSRARSSLVAFVAQQCGIVNPANPCRCEKHVGNKLQAKLREPQQLQRVIPLDSAGDAALREAQQHIDVACRATALLRAHPKYAMSERFITSLQVWLHNPAMPLLPEGNSSHGANS